jgi:ferredoxin
MVRSITKSKFYKLIEGLLKEYEVIGPKEIPNKGIFYQHIIEIKDLYLGEHFTTEPVKKFFLPPFEEIFGYGQDILIDPPNLNTKQRIIIGVRPCEAKGLTLLDKVFGSDYKDSFYINRRKRTIIIGWACANPDRECFCTSLGSSPVDSLGMDVLLFPIEDKIIIETITDRGKNIFSCLEEEINRDQRKFLQANKDERRKLVRRKIKIPVSLDKVFESDYWDKVSRSCIGCGICTYLCPTCHCFDLTDENRKRLRCYDGCSFADFTLEASGVNPRPTKKERYRQRVFHKFDYFKKNFGGNLCVGCGRCTRFCPVKINIAEIIDKLPSS